MKQLLVSRASYLLVVTCLSSIACQATPAIVTQPTPSIAITTAEPAAAQKYKVLWAFPTQDAIWGTATVDGSMTYIGSDDGNLYALATSDGHLKWHAATHNKNRSRPAVAGGHVYITSDDGYLYALEAHSGQQSWSTNIGNVTTSDVRADINRPDPTAFDIWQSSPRVVNGQVYVGSADGNVYALAADSGQINWTHKTGAKVRATPVIDQGTVYIGSWDGFLYALDAQTGLLRWKTPLGGQIQTTALIADGKVYCASRKASVVALDAQTGKLLWEHDYGTNMWVESSPLLVNGILYIGSSGNQYIAGLDSQTGNLYTLLGTGAFLWSTPLVVSNTLFIGAATYGKPEIGGLQAIRLVNGKFPSQDWFRWYLSLSAAQDMEENYSGVASSPVMADGVIFFGALDGRMYAVSGDLHK